MEEVIKEALNLQLVVLSLHALKCHGSCAQVNSEATDEEIEEALNFQLEELSIMADEELALIPQMAEWKPWDVRLSPIPPAPSSP